MPDPEINPVTTADSMVEVPAADSDPSPRRRTDHADDQVQTFVIEAARLLHDSHCEDVLVFDVRGMSPLTDYIVIATGTSDRQIKAVGSEVTDLGRSQGFAPYGSDSDVSSTWVVVDLVQVMIHLFEPATRGHYDLEMLWGDAPKISWRRK